MSEGWHKQRFTDRATAVQSACAQCGITMWLPASKVDEYKRCGEVCNAAFRADERQKRMRSCDTCAKIFYPRTTQISIGGGRFCSQKCNKPFHRASQAADVWERRIITMREKRQRGEWTLLFGARNPMWKGGFQAHRQRRKESGKDAAALRRYRKANPHKVREFAQRRAGKKLGRLEYGTIPRLLKVQRGRCAICKVSIARGYHLDHIVPIALGGAHTARNVQLLCAPCNLHKSNREPIIHMQSLGRLL